MGKYKNFRKRNKAKDRKLAPKGQSPGKVEPRTLHADLISLDDYRRLNACRVLSNIFGFSSNNAAVIEKLMGSEIISRLVMRLLDSNKQVQLEAIGAVGNLAKCVGISKLIGYIISCGTLTTLISIPVDFSNTSPDSDNLIMQLLSTLGALISCDDDIAIAFTNNIISAFTQQGGTTFLGTLVHNLTVNSSLPVLESVADFLLVVTDGLEPICRHLASLGLMPRLFQLISHALLSVETAVATTGAEAAALPSCQSLAIALKYLSVYVNLSQFMTDEELAASLSSADGCIPKLLSSSVSLFTAVQHGIVEQLEAQAALAMSGGSGRKDEATAGVTTPAVHAESMPAVQSDPAPLAAPANPVRERLYNFVQVLSETVGNLSFVLGERLESASNPAVVAAINHVSGSFVSHDFVYLLGASISQISEFIQRKGTSTATVSKHYDERVLTIELSLALEMADKLGIAFGNILALHQCANHQSKISLFNAAAFPSAFEALNKAIEIFFSSAQKAHSSSEVIGETAAADEVEEEASALTDTGTHMDADTAPAANDVATEMIDYADIHELALAATCSTMSALSSLCQDANTAVLKSVPAALFQSLCLQLCQGIASNYKSVVKSSLDVLTELAARDNELVTSGAPVPSDAYVITHRLNALFTNSLVRKLESFRQLPHCDNFHLQLAGMCLNSLIDLHSSDDDKILDTFIKFKLLDVLKASRLFCKNSLARKQSGIAMDQEDAEDEEEADLNNSVDESSLECMLQEIMENAKNLIDYKKSFLKSRGI